MTSLTLKQLLFLQVPVLAVDMPAAVHCFQFCKSGAVQVCPAQTLHTVGNRAVLGTCARESFIRRHQSASVVKEHRLTSRCVERPLSVAWLALTVCRSGSLTDICQFRLPMNTSQLRS